MPRAVSRNSCRSPRSRAPPARGDRAVARVGDHVLADPVAELDAALPPRQHRAAAVALHAEVGRDQPRERVLPDRLAVVVDDHRARLAVRRVVGRDEDRVGRGSGLAAGDRQRRDPQVGSAVPARRHRRAGRRGEGAGEDLADGAREGQPGRADARGAQQLPAGHGRAGVTIVLRKAHLQKRLVRVRSSCGQAHRRNAPETRGRRALSPRRRRSLGSGPAEPG